MKVVPFCELFIPYKKKGSFSEREFSKITIFLDSVAWGKSYNCTQDHLTESAESTAQTKSENAAYQVLFMCSVGRSC